MTRYQYDTTGGGAINEEVPSQHATSGPPGSGFVVSADPVVPGYRCATNNVGSEHADRVEHSGFISRRRTDLF